MSASRNMPYRRIFESAPDPVLLHDLEGNLLGANQAASTASGYPSGHLKGSHILSVLAEDSWLVLKTAEQNLISGGTTEGSVEIRLTRRDGSSFPCAARPVILEKGDGWFLFMVVLSDTGERRRLEENMHLYLQQATRAQEEERKRLAMELHDQTIQDLVALSRRLDALKSPVFSEGEGPAQELDRIRRQISDIIQAIRQISQNLRPPALDRLGLLPALGHLVSEFNRQGLASARVNTEGKQIRLGEETELTLFRITQEALNNALRHAQATRLEVLVKFESAKVELRINDNGKGFDPQKTWLRVAQNANLGLLGMQERAHLIGGSFSLVSEPGKGTTVVVQVPLAA